jgi:hypothetical protein
MFPAALDTRLYSAYIRNEYQKQQKVFGAVRALLALKSDNLIPVFCEPII